VTGFADHNEAGIPNSDVVVVRVSNASRGTLSYLEKLRKAKCGAIALVDEPGMGVQAYEHGADIVSTIPVDLDMLTSAIEALRRRASKSGRLSRSAQRVRLVKT
jgi:DNA-binding response OmpR family regulator